MSADTLTAYRHSGKFTVQGLVLPLGAAAVMGIPLGLAYAYLTRWNPFIYINLLATLGYGAVFGFVTAVTLRIGRVRNTALGVLCGFAAGVIGLYCEWSGTLHALVKDPPWVFRPDQVWRGMKVLYEHGSWGLHSGDAVTGIPLAIVWAIEGGIIVGFAVMLAYNFVANTPFCEKSLSWLEEEKKFDTLEVFSDATQIAALGTGSIQPLLDAKPRPENSLNFARVILKRSPRSQHFCTLRVQNVFPEPAKDGKMTEKVTSLTRDLVIPAEMFDLVAQFAQVEPAAHAAEAAPPPPETSAGTA